MMLAVAILAVSVVENAIISSPQIGTFFSLPQWMPSSVPSDRTPGSCYATEMTHRIDPTALAAVNACFEAFYERTYFANAGVSNVWNTSTYGPTSRGSDKHEFRFGLPSGSQRFVYEPDTNRVIETRRLVEYDNMSGLASALRHYYQIWIDRPNWWGGHDWNVLWSTSLMDGLETNYGTLDDRLPVIGWSVPESFLARPKRWVDAAPTLRETTSGNVLEWNESSEYSYNSIPWTSAWNVNFSEPVFGGELLQNYMERKPVFTNTADSVVGCGLFITNVTVEVFTNEYGISLGRPAYPNRSSTALYEVEVLLDTYGYTNDFSAGVSVPQVSMNTDGTGRAALFVWAEGFPWVPAPAEILIEEMTNIPGRIRRIWNDQTSFYFDMHVEEEGETPHADPGVGSAVFDHAYVEWEREFTNVTRVVGVEGLTNGTRRLFTDRMAGIGLTLGAMDRTYVNLTTPKPNVVTQYVGSAEKEYVSDIVIEHPEFEWDMYEQEWRVVLTQRSVPTPSLASTTDNSVTLGSSVVDGRFVRYATTASRGFELSYVPVTNNTYEIVLTQLDLDVITRAESVPPGRRFEITPDAVGWTQAGAPTIGGLVLIFRVEDEEPYDWFDFSHELDVPQYEEATIRVSATTSVEYRYGRTIGDPVWKHGYKTYPGEFSRVSRTSRPKLWSMYGVASHDADVHSQVIVGTELEEVSYNASRPSAFASAYRTTRDEYSSASLLRSAFEANWTTLRDKCDEMFESATDYDPADAVAVLGSLERNIPDALANIEITDGTKLIATPGINFGSDPSKPYIVTIRGSLGGGHAEVESVVWFENGTYIAVPATVPVLIGGWSIKVTGSLRVKSGYAPANEELYGAKVNGKIDSWSAVDWDWQALKRTKKSND